MTQGREDSELHAKDLVKCGQEGASQRRCQAFESVPAHGNHLGETVAEPSVLGGAMHKSG